MAFLMSAYMGQGIEYKSWDLVLHLWKKKTLDESLLEYCAHNRNDV